MPNSISPVITFAAYAIIARKRGLVLDSSTIFTSLALLSLITMPLASLFGSLPELFAAVACFGRIQKFILTDPRCDTRLTVSPDSGAETTSVDVDPPSREKQEPKVAIEPLEHGQAIMIRNGKFGWKTEDSPVLQNINVSFPRSKLTVLVGQVATGKTTLLKAVLGETSTAEGIVKMCSLDISFCDQTPWLTNETLRRNITGFSHFDDMWYSTVIRACALEDDITTFTEGDQCIVGSKGIALSGGQKQRVVSIRFCPITATKKF
jgi:ABC-type bacteriocin/lantibiotic exporter with double-glycine peptidase domain